MSLGRPFSNKTITVNSGEKIFSLTMVDRVKICGITFSNNKIVSHKANVLDKIEKLEKNLVMWLHRGLSIPGKIVIVNTFGISQLIYSMQMCKYYKDDLKLIELIIFKFLWNKKWNGNRAPDRIKREILKRDYEGGGLRVPDINVINESLKLRQFLRAIVTEHPIRHLQEYMLEKLDYDSVYQQEYSRISQMESVVEEAQSVINKITDSTREVQEEEVTTLQTELIARTNIYEYLSRHKKSIALNYYKRLYELGIESYIQLVREVRFPRSDEIETRAKFVIRFLPQIWQVILQDLSIDVDTPLEEKFPIKRDKAVKIGNITVKAIKARLRHNAKNKENCAYNVKLGIVDHDNINPFVVAKQVNTSVNLSFFKYRLLHGDIYTRERMFKFKMVSDKNCSFCQRLEDTKHLLWECHRVEWIWEKLNRLQEHRIEFKTLFIGFSPTNSVLESVITRVTRTIVSIDRSEMISEERLRREIIDHCILNIYALSQKKRDTSVWERLKVEIETGF